MRGPLLRHKFWGVALALVAVGVVAIPATAVADKSAGDVPATTVRVTAGVQARADLRQRVSIDPKLQYQLGVLARRSSPSRVRVIVQTLGRPNLRGLTRAGARIEAHVGGLVQAIVPATRLEAVAAVPGVRFVRRPSYQQLDAIPGEEVPASNALASIQKGWTGKGVKVAILDGGFGGYQQRIAEGELPSNVKVQDFCGGGHFITNTNHGTAVAEIVHEMAPGATLYLVCSETEVQFAQAEQYAKAQGAQIITHSGSAFNNGRGDGAPAAGTEGSVVADARQSGILWVNSSGNSAERHWSGTFVDTNGNGFMNFAPNNEGDGLILENREDVCIFLKWDEWPAATDDFDLFLLNQSGVPVAASQTRQTGTQPPTEQLCYQNVGARGAFFAAIGAFKATGTPRMDIFVRNVDPPLQYATPQSSVGDPGASPFAFTAGAICWQNNALEPYSGQGPTIDGRVKPDIAGQDAVSGATYGKFTACGQSGFTGTSASAPVVAAAAALVKEENPTFTADQIQAFLQTNAQDLGTPGPDDQFGYGKLFIPTPSTAGPTTADTTPPRAKAVRSKGVRGKAVKLLSQASDETGEVRIVETVKKGARTLAKISTGFAATKPGVTYYITWKVPATVSGLLSHCVQAFDHAGNKSPVSCAALTIAKV